MKEYIRFLILLITVIICYTSFKYIDSCQYINLDTKITYKMRYNDKNFAQRLDKLTKTLSENNFTNISIKTINQPFFSNNKFIFITAEIPK